MTPWLDFSGAPAMLIPAALIGLWRGAIDPATESYSDLNSKEPKTDYDRACAAAWPRKGEIRLAQSSALALYSEYDEHTWIAEERVVASGSWLPTPEQIRLAKWTDAFDWKADFEEYLLLNSAADGKSKLQSGDYAAIKLERGTYLVEFAFIEAECVGCFTRLTPKESAGET
jgi:Immunity protein 21